MWFVRLLPLLPLKSSSDPRPAMHAQRRHRGRSPRVEGGQVFGPIYGAARERFKTIFRTATAEAAARSEYYPVLIGGDHRAPGLIGEIMRP